MHNLTAELNPSQALLSPGPQPSPPHPPLLGSGAARQPSTAARGSPCQEVPVPLAGRLNHVSEGLRALAAVVALQAREQ